MTKTDEAWAVRYNAGLLIQDAYHYAFSVLNAAKEVGKLPPALIDLEASQEGEFFATGAPGKRWTLADVRHFLSTAVAKYEGAKSLVGEVGDDDPDFPNSVPKRTTWEESAFKARAVLDDIASFARRHAINPNTGIPQDVKRKPGRPRKAPTTTVRLPVAVVDAIQAHADREGKTFAEAAFQAASLLLTDTPPSQAVVEAPDADLPNDGSYSAIKRRLARVSSLLTDGRVGAAHEVVAATKGVSAADVAAQLAPSELRALRAHAKRVGGAK